MTSKTHSGTKKHHESTKPESCQTVKKVLLSSSPSSPSSDGLVRQFSHKIAAFYTEQCTSPSLFHNFEDSRGLWRQQTSAAATPKSKS